MAAPPLFKLVIFFLTCLLLSPVTFSAPANIVPRAYEINDPSLPPSVRSVCENGPNSTTVSNSTRLANGVTMTTGYCRGKVTLPNGRIAQNFNATAAGVSRPTCPSALNNCISRFGTQFQGNGWVSKCGARCDSTCYQGSGGPDPNDCQYIANQLWGRQPALFTLDPGTFVLLTYRSCGTGIQNQIVSDGSGCSQKMIYDYPDWAAVAQYLAWNCQGFQGARGGRCNGSSGIYVPNTSDFYIQVYTN
ncbi:hypothetical protein PIIN_02230 [Serendipita indica DSM 11827]|uniref:Uncharacterized protein n=1 Tax=Serendipita indica (strain DSM 11827) TaxID=1109443 RepID=G4TAP5_SERID|nr:hypothetical protein PIIN_02230 [Serendipita indica DSM 11827]